VKNGTVYWITGLSGAGKTTIGTLLYRYLKEIKDNVVFLDGDLYRPILFPELGYSLDERERGGLRLGLLLKMLTDQGIDTVVCTISMFHSVREWNRANLSNYIEIFLDVPMEILRKRDQKGLYTNNKDREVVGVGITAEFPKNPTLRIVNDGGENPEKILHYIIKELNL